MSAENLRIQIHLETSICESQMAGERNAIERGLGDGVCLSSLVRFQSRRRVPIEGHQIEWLVITGCIKLKDGLG